MKRRALFATILLGWTGTAGAQPLGTAFTYQGRLTDAGNPANGSYDLQLVLFDAASGGAQVGPTLTRDDVVVANGLFTTSLDFGAVFTGNKRWLELGVRPGASTGAYTTLAGRQELAPSPNAAFSSVTPWTGVSGKPAGFADDIDNDALGGLSCPNGQIAKRVGGVWACADDADSGGDITAVTAGTGLTGGGTTGAVTLNANLAGSGSANTIARSDHDHFSQAWSGSNATGLQVTNAGGAALRGLTTAAGATPGVFGSSQSTVGYGVHGQASATSGTTRGVFGEASSSDGIGVLGMVTSSGGGRGVYGSAQSTTGLTRGVVGECFSPLCTGVLGLAQSTTGSIVGVWGISNSSAGFGGYFSNGAGGSALGVDTGGIRFGDGTTQTTAAVSNTGDITAVLTPASSGLTGGASSGDVTLGVLFGGSGVSTSASRSDHNHLGVSWSGNFGFGTAFRVVNTGSGGFSDGIWGQADAAGNARGLVGYATNNAGTNSGVWGQADSAAGRGVFGVAPAGSGTTYGVYGQSDSSGGRGVYGITTAGNGTTYGVYGQAASPIGLAVYGQATATFGVNYGVMGETSSPVGYGVFGLSNTAVGAPTYGVYGQSMNGADGRGVGGRGVYGFWGTGSTAGAYGIDQNPAFGGVGLWGQSVSTTQGAGVFAQALGTNGGYGIYATTNAPTTGWAGYFVGRVNVTGTLSKGGGSFKIDHPLDPENKYLYHSFVESPDMKNIYDGNVVTDDAGLATVELPGWFEALNRDFRYQLTVIGQFAQAIVSSKIEANRFTIRTDKPSVEVSWQVTGIRKDPFAEKYRIPVEEDKAGDEVGTYLYPEAYGLTRARALDSRRAPLADRSAPADSASPTER